MPTAAGESEAELFQAGPDLAEVGTSCADQDDDFGETFIRPFDNRNSHCDNFLEHNRTFFEQHQKIQNILEQNEQTTRVLKYAASAFADMLANSSASNSVTKGGLTAYPDDEVKSQPSYDKELPKSVQNSPEPFPLALPLWEFQLSSNNPDMAKAVPDDLLDLNIPPLPAMDCVCIGGSEDDHKDFLLQGCPCDVHGREENGWEPILQFPSIDDNGGLMLKEDPWRTWPPSTLNLPAADILYAYNFGADVSHASATRSAPTAVSEGPNLQDQLLGKNKMASNDLPGTGVLETDRRITAGVDYLGDESSLIDQAYSGDSGSGEISLANDGRPTNGTQTDGLMYPSDVPSDGACSADCHVLVNSICNLSKVLLAHYGSKTSNPSEQGNIKNLEVAVLNLSKCLLHAHSNQTDSAETEEVQENKPALAEENAFISFSDTEEPGNDQFELKSSIMLEGENNEQVFARLKTLVELQSGKHTPIVDCSTKGMCLHSLEVSDKDADSNVGKDNDKPDEETLLVKQEQKSASSYLDSTQVEHRLALLKARPKWCDDVSEGAATINGEGIQVQDDYMAKRMFIISQAKQKLGLNMDVTNDTLEEIVPEIMKRRGIEDINLDSLAAETVWELQAAFMRKHGGVPAERIIYKSDSALDKLSDGEESGWEHV